MDQTSDSERDKGLQDLLRDYVNLEKQIKDRLKRRSFLLFADIFESTPFFDAFGNFEGLKWLQEYYDVVFPIVEAKGGEVLKTTGDGVMAKFETADAAVEAAIAIQKELAEDNERKIHDDEERRMILVRMGIHGGAGLERDFDVFGRFVNASARVQALANPEQILISEEVYTALGEDLQTRCKDLGYQEIRGQAKQMRLFEVMWNGGSVLRSATAARYGEKPSIKEKDVAPSAAAEAARVSRPRNKVGITAVVAAVIILGLAAAYIMFVPGLRHRMANYARKLPLVDRSRAINKPQLSGEKGSPSNTSAQYLGMANSNELNNIKSKSVNEYIKSVLVPGVEERTNYGNYSVRNMLDGRLETSWQVSGGRGIEIVITLNKEIAVGGLLLTPGFIKFQKDYGQAWPLNNRIKTALISVGDRKVTANFDDQAGWYLVKAAPSIMTNEVKITVEDIYTGARWNDLAISEIIVVGNLDTIQDLPPVKRAGGLSSEELAEEEFIKLVNDWTAAHEARDLKVLMTFYAPALETYYDEHNTPRSIVLSSKSKLRTDFKEIQMVPNDFNIKIQEGRVEVTFDKTVSATNGKKYQARVRSELAFKQIGGRWLIVSERDLITRGKEGHYFYKVEENQ